MSKLISLTVPVFNEEDVIEEFLRRAIETLEKNNYSYEIVLVDDGSWDRTVAIIKDWALKNTNIKLIAFSFNHGKEYAVSAAIAHAKGDYMIYMDPDLQDPPYAIPDLVTKLEEGPYDIVYGIRKNRQDKFLVKMLSSLFWSSLRKMTDLPIPNDLSVYRIFTRSFADEFLKYNEVDRFIEGIFFKIGRKWTTLPVPHEARHAGISKFNFGRRLKLAINAAIDFSEKPLTLMAKFSAVVVLLSLISVLTLLGLRLFIEFQIGWPSTAALILLAMGIQLFSLSLVGLYVGKIYKQVKCRPLFSIKERINVQETDLPR